MTRTTTTTKAAQVEIAYVFNRQRRRGLFRNDEHRTNRRRGENRSSNRRLNSRGASCSSPIGNVVTPSEKTRKTTTTNRRKALLAASGLVLGTKYYDNTEEAKAFIDLPSRLHNRYFLVRHGESTLDVRNQILSNPSYKYDTTYGLTAKGVEQVHEAARIIVEEYDGSPSWLYTSNFQRSFQTALVMREDLGLLFSEVRTEFSGLLDPRKMGSLDFQDQSNWKEVYRRQCLLLVASTLSWGT